MSSSARSCWRKDPLYRSITLCCKEQPTTQSSLNTLENVERNHILRALNETRWVIHGGRGAAEILGINPSTLRSRMEKLGIRRS